MVEPLSAVRCFLPPRLPVLLWLRCSLLGCCFAALLPLVVLGEVTSTCRFLSCASLAQRRASRPKAACWGETERLVGAVVVALAGDGARSCAEFRSLNNCSCS